MDIVEPDRPTGEGAESLDMIAHSLSPKKCGQGDTGEFGFWRVLVSFVNQGWLDLVTEGVPQPALTEVPIHSISEELLQEIRLYIDLWSREEFSEELFAQFRYMRPVDGFRLPVAGGENERLLFADDVLLIIVPSLYNTYNDYNLTSMAAGSNIVFTGVTPTQQLLERHGLSAQSLHKRGFKGQLQVVYIAEEGLLLAQFTKYIVWLRSLALFALGVAFVVATAISAFISGLLKAKRDFAVRLSGQSWVQILEGRIAREVFIGGVLVALIVLIQKPDSIIPALVVCNIWLACCTFEPYICCTLVF